MKKLVVIVCIMFALSNNYLAAQVSGNIYELNGVRKELIQALPDDNIEKYWYNDQYFTQDYSEMYEFYSEFLQERYDTVTPQEMIATPDGEKNYLLFEFADNDKAISTFFTENEEIINNISQITNNQYKGNFKSLSQLELDIYENNDAIIKEINEYQFADFLSELQYVVDIAENKAENIERKKISDAINKQSDLTDMEKLTLYENSGYEIPFVDSHYTTEADYDLLASKVDINKVLNDKISRFQIIEIGALIIVFGILTFIRVTKNKTEKK